MNFGENVSLFAEDFFLVFEACQNNVKYLLIFKNAIETVYYISLINTNIIQESFYTSTHIQ